MYKLKYNNNYQKSPFDATKNYYDWIWMWIYGVHEKYFYHFNSFTSYLLLLFLLLRRILVSMIFNERPKNILKYFLINLLLLLFWHSNSRLFIILMLKSISACYFSSEIKRETAQRSSHFFIYFRQIMALRRLNSFDMKEIQKTSSKIYFNFLCKSCSCLRNIVHV